MKFIKLHDAELKNEPLIIINIMSIERFLCHKKGAIIYFNSGERYLIVIERPEYIVKQIDLLYGTVK